MIKTTENLHVQPSITAEGWLHQRSLYAKCWLQTLESRSKMVQVKKAVKQVSILQWNFTWAMKPGMTRWNMEPLKCKGFPVTRPTPFSPADLTTLFLSFSWTKLMEQNKNKNNIPPMCCGLTGTSNPSQVSVTKLGSRSLEYLSIFVFVNSKNQH